jgi:hypothetical protein
MGEGNLTARQAEMKKFIEEYFSEHGYAPSYREIMKKVGIPSLSVVRYNLERLQREDILDRDPRVARGIRPHTAQLRSIRVWGYIAAGEPMPVPGVTEPLFGADEALAISRDLLPRDRDLFALIVRGDSMIDASPRGPSHSIGPQRRDGRVVEGPRRNNSSTSSTRTGGHATFNSRYSSTIWSGGVAAVSRCSPARSAGRQTL